MNYQRPNVLIFFEEIMSYFVNTYDHVGGACNCAAGGARVCHGAK